MNFEHSPRAQELLARLIEFQEQEIAPREEAHHHEQLALADPWVVLPVIEELKAKAKSRGLVEPVPAADQRLPARARRPRPVQRRVRAARRADGRARSSPPKCSTATPPTPATWRCCWRYGSDEQKERWLTPLLDGDDPLGVLHDRAGRRLLGRHQHAGHRDVDGDEVVLNGRKWWTTGVGHPELPSCSSSWA